MLLRHAGAKEVHVQAKVSANSLEIVVRMSGRGFEPPPSPVEGRQHGLETCAAAPRPSAEPWNCTARGKGNDRPAGGQSAQWNSSPKHLSKHCLPHIHCGWRPGHALWQQ